jgi:conjugative transposon TraN protein
MKRIIITAAFVTLGCLVTVKAQTPLRTIAPNRLEVTFSKTVHVLFPSPIRYVDLGSQDLIAAKADDAENVLRIKAAAQGFEKETTLSVITEDGSYYPFNVVYADEPYRLSLEIKDRGVVSHPQNHVSVGLEELRGASPRWAELAMKSIYLKNEKNMKVKSKASGVQCRLKGIYAFDGLLYFHLEMKNGTAVPFVADYVSFTLRDKRAAKRTAVQELPVVPVRTYNRLVRVNGHSDTRTVYVFPIFTIPKGKRLVIEVTEREGGRHQVIKLDNSDLMKAREITELRLR